MVVGFVVVSFVCCCCFGVVGLFLCGFWWGRRSFFLFSFSFFTRFFRPSVVRFVFSFVCLLS